MLPVETLRRVLRVAKFDGISVLALAGLFALGSAALGDYKGALVGIVIAGAGAFELHGASLLTNGQPQGVSWLVNSQLYLLTAVLAYVGWRLLSYDPEQVRRLIEPMMHAPEMQAQLDATGATEEDLRNMLRLIYQVSYGMVGGVTLLYQGGLARYYHRRRAAITAALAERPEP
ncbi:MAG: hypothetical protein EXS39_00530 [Opitutaceae bacterium]|nr:hypothetical protein [Opitutaceae bacterium]